MLLLSVKNPRILAAAALRGIHDERAGLQGHARQAAGNYGAFFAVVEAIGTKINMAAGDAAGGSVVGRHARKRDYGLRDVVSRIGANVLAAFFDAGAVKGRANEHAVT